MPEKRIKVFADRRFSHHWARSRQMKRVINFIFFCLAICPGAALDDRKQPDAIVSPVGVRHLEYFDVKRGHRPVVLDVYYPASITRDGNTLFVVPFSTGFKAYKNARIALAGTKYPWILLSHGRSGNRFKLAWLATYLASHGYVVGSMDHYYANSYHLSFEYVAIKIWERPIDVSTHITHLLNHPIWKRFIDGSRIGAAGHSQGGMTALWVGGATVKSEKFLNYQRGRRNESRDSGVF